VEGGKAEPGRDIFAPPPQVEVMSEDKLNAPPVEDNEPKAVSAVGVSPDEALPKQDEGAYEMPENGALTAPVGDVSSSSDDALPPVAAGTTPQGSEPAKAKIQGPVDAEQAEADEVRQELFPDAVA
jgi:hypothetical protein